MRKNHRIKTTRASVAARTTEVYPRTKAYTALERDHDPYTDTTLLYGIRRDGTRVGTTAAVWALNDLSLFRESKTAEA